MAQICHILSGISTGKLQREVIEGAIHDKAQAEALVAGTVTLRDAFTRVPKAKQEWLAFIGLYPFQSDAPIATALALLLADPEAFKGIVVAALRLFWDAAFQATWHQMAPLLATSSEEKARLLATCTLGEFAKTALLRIEVDDHEKVIRAARGGYELAVAKIRQGCFLPSAFNDKRYWTAYEFADGVDVYFPYFDPSISLDPRPADRDVVQQPETDPFLLFRALGDSTRYAMVTLLAKQARSALELARELGLSKPTISHHVHVLRDAGLLAETRQSHQAGAVLLSLNRSTFASLGEAVRRRFL